MNNFNAYKPLNVFRNDNYNYNDLFFVHKRRFEKFHLKPLNIKDFSLSAIDKNLINMNLIYFNLGIVIFNR